MVDAVDRVKVTFFCCCMLKGEKKKHYRSHDIHEVYDSVEEVLLGKTKKVTGVIHDLGRRGVLGQKPTD